MGNEINNLKLNIMQINTDLKYIKGSLDKNEEQHKEILDKIDNLGETFQGKIQDKADHKETFGAIKGLAEAMESKFVTKDMFSPVQKVVYGMVGAMLLAIIAGVMALILKKPVL